MKETDVQILCGCDASSPCPQGRIGSERQCVIVVPEDDLFRIVMALPEFKRRYTVSPTQDEVDEPTSGQEDLGPGTKELSQEEIAKRFAIADKLLGGKPSKRFNSTSDDRVQNNVMRHEYKVLNEDEKFAMKSIKDHGLLFHRYLDALGSSRELSLAKTNVEQAVMWAVKHVTG